MFFSCKTVYRKYIFHVGFHYDLSEYSNSDSGVLVVFGYFI